MRIKYPLVCIYRRLLGFGNVLMVLIAPNYRPSLEGERHALLESSVTRSTSQSSSSVSKSQDLHRSVSTDVTHESVPAQGLPSYRKQPSPPNVFAFLDQEAASRGATPTSESIKNVEKSGKTLTREQMDKDNEFMAIVAASAEQAGFDADLVLGSGVTSKSSIVSGDKGATLSVSPSSIARSRSPSMEEVEDEDSPHIKRQLGQHELPVEVTWSQEELETRKKSQSRTESLSHTESRSAQYITQSSQTPKPDPAYQISTPKALEWVPAHVPLPQPTPSSTVSPPKEPLPSHSAPPTESVSQERKNRAPIVERSAPPSRSASLSSSFRSMMGSVREESGVERPATSRSSSLSRIFRSRADSSKKESSHDGASVVGDNIIRTEASDIEPRPKRSESARRGREQGSRNGEEEPGLGTLGRREGAEEIGGAHDRTQFGSQREEFSEPRRSLERRATEQWSTERQSRDTRPLERRSTDNGAIDRRAREDRSLPRRGTEQWSTERQEEQSNERHSRRSMESVYRSQETNTREHIEDIKEDEAIGSEAETLDKDKSPKVSKVSTWGKVFGWGGKPKGDSKGEVGAAGVGRALTQTRPDLVNPPSHRRSVSEAGGQRNRPIGPTRNNTEEWEQVTVTPQKSGASSLREVDMSSSYERVDNDNMSTNSAPVAPRDEFDPYPSEGKEGFKRTFDTNLPQHVEARIASFTTLETTNPEISTPEAEERPRRGGASFGVLLKAARRFKEAGQRGSQAPPRSVEEKPIDVPAVIRPVDSNRTDTDISEYDTSSSAGVSLRQAEFLEQQGQVEDTWGYTSRGDVEEQRAAERVPLPTPVTEDEETRKETASLSRLPLSRSMSLKQRSSKSLRKEVEAAGDLEESHIGRNDEVETGLRRSRRQISKEDIESSHHSRMEIGSYREEFTESRHSLERRATDQMLPEGQSLDRQSLQRRSTETWPAERQLQDKKPLLRRSTEHWSTEGQSLPRRPAVGATEESEGQEDFEKGLGSRLPLKKGQNMDRQVKPSANPHAHAHDGEQVAKTFNCVEKPASALVLTLSEGVDLSSDVKEKQEEIQSSFEPPDIFDDRDSPPSYENFPPESPKSLVYSPTQQQEFFPDAFSFVSRTPSPVLPPAAVDIYERFPALSQNNSPIYSPQPVSLESQNTGFKQVPVLHEETLFLPLSDLSTYIPAETPKSLQSLSQIEIPSSETIPQTAHKIEYTTIPTEGFPSTNITPSVPDDHSPTPINEPPISPTIEVSQPSPPPQSKSSMETIPEAFREPSLLSEIEESAPTDRAQEPLNTPGISSLPHASLDPSEGLFSIPEETSVSSSSPLSEALGYVPVDAPGSQSPSEAEESSPAIRASAVSTHMSSTPSEHTLFISENASTSTIAEAQSSMVLSEVISTRQGSGVSEDLPHLQARLPLSPIYEDQESAEEASLQTSSPSSTNIPVEVSEGLLALPLPLIQLQQSPVEHQFSKEPPVLQDGQSQPRDSLFEDRSVPPEEFSEDLQRPIHEAVSLFAIPHDFSSFPSSEPQIPPSFPTKSSSSGQSSPHLQEPVPYQLSLPDALQVEIEVAQPELPQLNARFSYDGPEVLPGLPPSSPSSPTALISAQEESLPHAMNDSASFVVGSKKNSSSRPLSVPASPVAASEQGLDSLAIFPGSNSSSLSIKVTELVEPEMEIPALLSQPSSPQLSASRFEPESDLPEALAELPESFPVSSVPTINELTQTTVSRSPSVVAEDKKSLASSPLSSPASPTLLPTIFSDLPQLPSSDPNSPYDLPQASFEFSELPVRDHVSLSPIPEELSDSAASRSPSTTDKDEYFQVLPVSTSGSPAILMAVQNGLPEPPQDKPLSPVQDLQSLGSTSPIVQHEVSNAINPTSPTFEAIVLSDDLQIPQSKLSLSDLVDQPQLSSNSYAFTIEPGVVALIDSPSSSLSTVTPKIFPESRQSETSLSAGDQSPAAEYQISSATDSGTTAIEASPSKDMGAQLDQPLGVHTPVADINLASKSAPTLPASSPSITPRKQRKEHDYSIPELSSEQLTRYEVQYEDIFLQESEARGASRQPPMEASSPRNEGSFPEPEVASSSEEIPTSPPIAINKHAIFDVPGVDNSLQAYDPSYLPEPEDLTVTSLAVSVETIANAVSEIASVLPTDTPSLDTTGLTQSEIESVTRRFSIEGIQLPSLHMGGTDSVSKLEALPPPKVNAASPLLVSTDPLVVEVVEADEHPSSSITTNISDILEEPITGEFEAILPAQWEPPQKPIYELPPLEINVSSESIKFRFYIS